MRNPQSTRAAIYARVSQDKRAGRSVAEQEAESVAACEVAGWDVTEVYRDNDVSASRFTTKSRPDWARLVGDLGHDKFDVIVLWEPSRGSRDMVAWATLLDTCRREQVLVHVTSHSHTYDLTKPRDWRSLAEDGVDSAYESEKASQRITRSMHANAVAGRPHGRIPYGYVRRYDPTTRALLGQEADPQTAPIVVEVIGRLARAEPVITVTRDLNARGIPSPTGKQWTRQIVRRLATRETYVGRREYDGETYDGDWPALVPLDTFYAAKRLLEDPARRTTKPGRVKYLLTYLARCGVCSEQLSAATRGYFCPAGHVGAQVGWLDEIVESVILARLDDPAVVAAITAPDDAAVVAARDRVATLRERLADFRDAAAAGDLTPASLAHVETKLLSDIAAATKDAEHAGAPAALRDLLGAEVIADRWAEVALTTRREVIDALAAVTLNRSVSKGRHGLLDLDRVSIEWKGST